MIIDNIYNLLLYEILFIYRYYIHCDFTQFETIFYNKYVIYAYIMYPSNYYNYVILCMKTFFKNIIYINIY